MEDKEDDKKQGSCEQRWSHKFVNDTWPREKRRRKSVLHTVFLWDFRIQWTSHDDLTENLLAEIVLRFGLFRLKSGWSHKLVNDT